MPIPLILPLGLGIEVIYLAIKTVFVPFTVPIVNCIFTTNIAFVIFIKFVLLLGFLPTQYLPK